METTLFTLPPPSSTALRTTFPETSKLIVAKNTLVLKAIEGTKWESLKPCMKGMNAWLFVHSEEIPAAIKPYRSFQKEKKLEDNDFSVCEEIGRREWCRAMSHAIMLRILTEEAAPAPIQKNENSPVMFVS
ncbi:hypothetical protein E3N88_46197 [Mikania micrantha]|uniref:Uncharacterized protein n=1 Tax=Mikania micrantha TaxID=192012 RepID=A0A5N6L9C3_9ASTR|nr:hypothetical protein E3N88_46197 [Mikania micrantha]